MLSYLPGYRFFFQKKTWEFESTAWQQSFAIMQKSIPREISKYDRPLYVLCLFPNHTKQTQKGI